MERAEAEAIYDGGREFCVEVLLRFARLEEELQVLRAENAALTERVAELEGRLRQSSRNSSLPPSQDPPSAPPRPPKPSSGRQRGGQPGREGRHRPLLPLEQVGWSSTGLPAVPTARANWARASSSTPPSRSATRSGSCRR